MSVSSNSSARLGDDVQKQKQKIALRLWDLDPAIFNPVPRFNAYFAFFDHHRLQMSEHDPRSRTTTRYNARDVLLSTADLLKKDFGLPRQQLRESLVTSAGRRQSTSRALGTTQPSYGTQPRSQDAKDLKQAVDTALTTTVGAMFAINLTIYPEMTCLGPPRLDWREKQSLKELVEETFPTYEYSDEPHTPIKANRLRARYLENHADVQLEWTQHLPDHLKLDVGDRTKTLRIFDLVSLLEMMYENMKDQPWNASLGDSLQRGCYTPAFLYETLQTILLLFPPQDRQWLEEKINFKPRWYHWRGEDVHTPDQRLSVPFQSHHGETVYVRPLTTRRQLFERYPHWAVKLHNLYAEAEDPAPVSWFGRWAERRKAARHTFWLTFVALMAAAFFGILASILGAIQVWISYCTWKENKSHLCA